MSIYLWFVLLCSSVTSKVWRANLQQIFLHPLTCQMPQSGATGASPAKGVKTDCERAPASCEGGLRELGLLALKKTRLEGASHLRVQVLEGKVPRGQSQVCQWTRGNGHELKRRRFPLNFRKPFCSCEVTEHGTGCLGRWGSFPPWRCLHAAWAWLGTQL